MRFFYNQKNGAIYPYHKAYFNIPHMQEIDAATAAKILDERRRQAEEIRQARQLLMKQATETGFTEVSQQLAELANQTPAKTEAELEMLRKVEEETAEKLATDAKRKAAPKPRKRKRKKKDSAAEADAMPATAVTEITSLDELPADEAPTAVIEATAVKEESEQPTVPSAEELVARLDSEGVDF
jgi:hypothetical protein